METEKKKIRALGYALSVVAFQEVGEGEDKYLNDVRTIIQEIQELCFNETGIIIEGYPTEFIELNKELIKKNYPFLKHSLDLI